MTKHTDGRSDRPTDATSAEGARGLPDDPSAPVEASDEEIARVRSKLMEGDRSDERDDLERQLERPKHGTA